MQDDECFDLLLGALALAFVLSLASAIPIFVVCRMAECKQEGGNSTTAVVAAAGAAAMRVGMRPFRRLMAA